jgi:DHA2 family multidrug resistance protein-like MFS transporter
MALTPQSSYRAWLGLSLLTLPLFVLALDASVLYLAASHIGAALSPTAPQWLWILDIYGFLIAGCLVTMGSIGDRIGRRRLLLIGAGAFAVASTLAAYAPNPTLLIGARALLGVAGATLMPSTLALIRTLFPDDRRRTIAIAVWMTTFSAGVALGPVIGGALLNTFWWGAVFLLAVPVMLLVLLFGRWLLPESRATDPGPVDPVSVLLSVASVISLVYGMKVVADTGLSTGAVGSLAAGGLLGLVFLRRQRRLSHPLVDLGLFTERRFRTALTLLLLGIFAVTAVNFLVPQFLQSVAGLKPLQAGLLTAPLALAAVGGSLAAPWLAGRYGPAWVISIGATGSVAGYLLLTQVRTDSVGLLLVGGALAVLGLSPMTVLTTDLVVSSAPPDRSGSAAALSETSGELGVALGVAVLGSLVTAAYRWRFDRQLPTDVPGEVAASAREHISQAGTAVADLPATLAQAVTDHAAEAFAFGIRLVGYVGAGLMLGLVALALTGLNRQSPAPGE